MQGRDLRGELGAFLTRSERTLIGFRRDIHMHPELAFAEYRTTQRIVDRLTEAGLAPEVMPKGTGVICDVGSGGGPTVALRADIDALALADEKDVPYSSTVPGVCHACGHDVHTAVLLGTGLFLAEQARAGLLPGRVRLIFQPAEELPGGAREVVAVGGLIGVDRVFGLHCDPKVEVGQVGLKTGPITSACDMITVHVNGPGGHTARPHLTADLVFALGKILTELPAGLSRRVDPRSSLSLVWGRVESGSAANVIPEGGVAEGTVRCTDEEAWRAAPDLIKALLESVATPYGVEARLDYTRGVPPVVNDEESVQMLSEAALRVLGADSVVQTQQSLGGEDFGWFLENVPGAYARLGTRMPGTPPTADIHQSTFDVDESCIGVGVRFMAATALTALWEGTRPGTCDLSEQVGEFGLV
ncbi:amidohydrolase [Sinosporangium siamense]|uniref:Peptidase n=1 Tax=Sinosporangium siamense TaxID=1367973 RepID=A0A919REF1_9ACTN|nr:amidohydrolase [Sinosporangium siamense]GII90899.1 peptidase [Sinosporangium siamense]